MKHYLETFKPNVYQKLTYIPPPDYLKIYTILPFYFSNTIDPYNTFHGNTINSEAFRSTRNESNIT